MANTDKTTATLSRLLSRIILTMPLAGFAALADNVPIASVISNGEAGNASNKTSNVWLTVDDSLSMGTMKVSLYYENNDPVAKDLVMKNCGSRKVSYWHPDYDRSVCRYMDGIGNGWLAYDSSFPYEDYIPVDHLGNQLPLPNNVDETYKLGANYGDIRNRSWGGLITERPIDPFIYYAVRNMGVKYRPSFINENNRDSVPFLSASVTMPIIKINKTSKGRRWAYVSTYDYEFNGHIQTNDNTCDLASNKKRCQVWKTYYSTRMLATKSALSIAMYKYKDADFRLGYTDLLAHAPVFNWRGNWGRFSAWFYWKANATPYVNRYTAENWSGDDSYDTPYIPRSQLFPLRNNSDASTAEFYKWLFTLSPAKGGTPTRETVTYLLKKIKQHAKTKANSTSKQHSSIWLEDMTQPYDEETNREYTCRLNHNIIFTDGAWRDTPESRAVENMKAFNGNSIETESSTTLPDGEVYSPSAAYAKVYRASSGILTLPSSMTSCDIESYYCWKAQRDYIIGQNSARSGGRMMGMADIAFQGWATDLDGDNGNNKAGDDGALVLRNENQKKYIDKNGNMVIYKNNGSEYWQHFNDPAAWQHFNTHMIGFGLGPAGDNFNKLYLNAPQSTKEAEALDNDVTNGGVGLNAFMSGSKSWTRGKHSGNFGPKNQLSDAGRTAITGRGMYFNAKGPAEVIEAFDRVFSRIEQSGEASPPSVGGGGTVGGSQTLDNSYYLTRYDIESFTGELEKYQLFDGTRDGTEDCFGRLYDEDEELPQIGTICSAYDWNAAKQLIDTGWSNRNIITRKRQKNNADLTSMNDSDLTLAKLGYEGVDFAPGNISTAQRSRLITGFRPTLSANFDDGNPLTDDNETRLEKLFNYVMGDAEQEDAGLFKNRNEHSYISGDARNILGAIIRSAPTFVGIPTAYVAHLDTNTSLYSNYLTFVRDFIDNNEDGEKEMLYVGANDGMLHAFAADSGEEVFAYVPSAVYDKLPQLVETSDTDISFVDGNIDVQAINIGNNWYRALVAGMGGGAKGLFALDVTADGSNDTPTAASVRDSENMSWEYGELESKLFQMSQDPTLTNPQSNVGNILAKPAIIQLQDNNWVAIVGNGYNSESNKAAVIVIDLVSGKPIQELVLDNAYTDDSKPNGLGPLYFVAYPGKELALSNQYDRAYAGDLQGNLWVFDLTNSSTTGNGGSNVGISLVSRGSDNNGTPLFTATDDDGKAQPITVYPLAMRHPLGYGYLVHFGTGSLFEENDLSTEVNNSIYAIWDDWIADAEVGLPNNAGSSRSTVQKSQLNEVILLSQEATVQGDDGDVTQTVRYLDTANNDSIDWALQNVTSQNHRGWYIDLEVGERAWQPAFTTFGADNVQAISYNTVKYSMEDGVSNTSCSIAGTKVESWQLAFNTNDAAAKLASSGVLDINEDNSVSEADVQATDESGNSIEHLGAFSGISSDSGVIFNSTTQRMQNTDLTRLAAGERKVCYFTVQLTSDSSGGLTPKSVERCSYFSSWTELK